MIWHIRQWEGPDCVPVKEESYNREAGRDLSNVRPCCLLGHKKTPTSQASDQETYIMWPLLLALFSMMPVSFTTMVVGDLPAPTNVHIDSYNMKHILRWDPVQVPNQLHPVTYRVECELINESRPMCVGITETQCDFTDKIKPFWRGEYKVRAELGESRSVWVNVSEFQASLHTKIGPVQSLILKSHANTVTVDFSPPFSPIPQNFKFKYWLYYWKKGTEDKTEVPLRVSTHYIMGDLEELTEFCVQVKASTDYIEGQTSDPQCAKTMIREYTGNDLAVIIVCVILVCVICSVAGLLLYKKHVLIKHFLYPPFRMPNHIQEFLQDRPEQPYEAMCDPAPKEEHYDHISVVEVPLFQEVNQISAEPNQVSAEKT
ncbi:interferon gamma receptor 2 [Rhinoderma darwinii]|uniref:interferon gamma receptor 2 n=1 Tax=Rhinoderma darwinii TaxID=43563 RepID=UPI003F665E92